MSVHSLSPARAIDPVAQAKTELAAAHRLATLHELDEGPAMPTEAGRHERR